MKTRESALINLALDYKKQYQECCWWNFKKRSDLYKKRKEVLAILEHKSIVNHC